MPGTSSGDAGRERLLAAVESSPSGLLMVDGAGFIVLVNREVERMFGYARDELLGASVEMLLPHHLEGSHRGLRSGFLRQPAARPMGAGRDLFGLRKDGTEVPVEIGLSPVVTGEGTFILASVVDITARKSADAERARLQEQLRRAQRLEVMGTLASGIAHDFNNVLGAIVGFAEMALIRSESGPASEDLDALLQAADRGREVVQRILGYAREGSRKLEPLSLPDAVGEAGRLLRAAIPSTVSIRISAHPGTPNVLADATAVHQILLNLATNAARAMPDGGALEFVLEPFYLRDHEVRARPGLREGPYVRLLVRDDGIGIPHEIQDRVFDAFFTTGEAGGGSGLGLAMVSRLMTDHGGGVRLESEPGAGTTVECLFPAIQEAVADVKGAVKAAPRGAGQRILYVDDEQDLAKVGQRRLQMLGYDVVMETDPVRALECFRAAPDDFDLVITDYTMPALTGLALADRLSAIRPGIPIVMLTGYVDLPPERFDQAGVRAVLNKPVTLSQLGTVVNGLLGSTPSP